MNALRMTTLFLVLAAACEPIADPDAVESSAVSGGSTRPGTTPPPTTCGGPRCFSTNTGAYAVLARSSGVHPALEAHATEAVAGDFDSSGRDGVVAVTSSDHQPAVIARTTASNGSAIEARAIGPRGRPVKLATAGGGTLLHASRNGNTAVIDKDGNLRHNGVRVGKEGPRGPTGPAGKKGANGPTGPNGASGNDTVRFHCGRYDSCADACTGFVVGEAVGECEVAAFGGGCYYGGSEGRCCACRP